MLSDARRSGLTPQDDTPQTLDEEAGLIRDARKGDRRAFAALVERYWDRLYRWMFTWHSEGAEDLCQEAFLKAMTGLSGFREGKNFRAWLFRIAYNAFINQHRKASRQRCVSGERGGERRRPGRAGDDKESLKMLAKSGGSAAGRFSGRLPLASGRRSVLQTISPTFWKSPRKRLGGEYSRRGRS